MTLNSCLYDGRVRHRRHGPVAHAFSYRLFMVYLDLAELDQVFEKRWLWSTTRTAPARFRREDHLGDAHTSLDDAVRELVTARTGHRPDGPIRLHTHLRYFGYCFNPVSFYYCFSADESRVENIVAEVNNTPWGERHLYVLGSAEDGSATGHSHELQKQFHVSPFMPMDIDYDWRFTMPERKLAVHMKNYRKGQLIFDATLDLEKKPITTLNLSTTIARQPVMTARVTSAIYLQALRLWLKHVPFYDHPSQAEAPGTANRT